MDKKRGDEMTLEDEFKYLVGGYYGIMAVSYTHLTLPTTSRV